MFKSQGTLRQHPTKVKTIRPKLRKKSVIYELPYKDCESKCIGETGRNLHKGLTEQKAAKRRGDRKKLTERIV